MQLKPDTLARIRARLTATKDERVRSRKLIETGRWSEAEPDSTRAAGYTLRIDRLAGHKEAVRGTNDFLRTAFLVVGAKARRAVARIKLELPGESRSGSGFLISPQLFLTNQHVIADEADARLAQIVFDDELDETGNARPTTTFSLAPDKLFLSSPEAELDFALIAVGPRVSGAAAIEDFGYCPLSATPDRHQLGINANIVQHPGAQKKLVVIRNNFVVARTDEQQSGFLHYETDTDEGSSGSPVFNDVWDVIALHHYGEASVDVDVGPGAKTRSVNEGIRISSIASRLSELVPQQKPEAADLLRAALVLWKSDPPKERPLSPIPRTPAAQPESPPAGEAQAAPAHGASEAIRSDAGAGKSAVRETSMSNDGNEIRLVAPLEITIRLGARTDAVPSAPAPERKLSSKPGLAESAKIDRDYSNRNGFDPDFVPGVEIDLDDITAPLKKSIAPLHEERRKAAQGELAYQNFSVVMHKTNRVALLTATNIDGPSYIAIDRQSGEPAKNQPRPEGDSWYTDPRISDSYILTNDFYSSWSHIFDRGHLTRRNDPTWGDNATRANKDTFHFTNCSPQHWKFNESIQFWQGVERYVLEQGLWESGLQRRLTVLQGPLYDGPQPLYADDVQVPNAFWKIVVWKGATGLKSVALIVDQTDLLSLTRKGGMTPDPDARADVSEFRSSVAEIARRSGLDFGKIAKFDTARDELPKVGEALRRLTAMEQIRLT